MQELGIKAKSRKVKPNQTVYLKKMQSKKYFILIPLNRPVIPVKHVLWSNELCFSISQSDGRILVWQMPDLVEEEYCYGVVFQGWSRSSSEGQS